jgi:hypothetical protein
VDVEVDPSYKKDLPVYICACNNQGTKQGGLKMKCSRKSVRTKENAIPQLRFEDQRLTSFAGLVVLHKFFQIIGLKTQLQKCFRHRALGKVFDRTTIFMQLIVHLLLGFRELRDCDHYRDDPMVQRLLGLKRLPDVATLSRMLKEADEKSVTKLRQLLADMVLDRIASLALPRITLDFDGSVQSTQRRAEGTAVGFNKKKKGARSYYPLFCTLAQTGQVLNFLHRSGNVHDSNGAQAFIVSTMGVKPSPSGDPFRIPVSWLHGKLSHRRPHSVFDQVSLRCLERKRHRRSHSRVHSAARRDHLRR